MPRAARQGDAHGYIHDDAAHTDLDRPPTSQRTAQRRRTRRRTGPLARGRGLPDSNARCSAHGTPLRPVPDFRSPRGARGPPITPCRHRQSPRTRAQALLLQATKLRRLRFTYGMARSAGARRPACRAGAGRMASHAGVLRMCVRACFVPCAPARHRCRMSPRRRAAPPAQRREWLASRSSHADGARMHGCLSWARAGEPVCSNYLGLCSRSGVPFWFFRSSNDKRQSILSDFFSL